MFESKLKKVKLLAAGLVTSSVLGIGGLVAKNALSEPAKIEASPAAAQKALGEERTVEFPIAGGINLGKRVIFNSLADFKDPNNFNVVVETDQVPGAQGWNPKQMKGKTVKAVGIISEYQNKDGRKQTQIVIRDPKKVEIK